MWLFKKKKVLDLTAKKDSVPRSIILKRVASSSRYTDLTPASNSSSSEDTTGLGFLGSIASSSSADPSYPDLTSSPASSQHLKVKLEDAEYKLDSLRKKVDALLDRMDLTEKKIDRLEGR